MTHKYPKKQQLWQDKAIWTPKYPLERNQTLHPNAQREKLLEWNSSKNQSNNSESCRPSRL